VRQFDRAEQGLGKALLRTVDFFLFEEAYFYDGGASGRISLRIAWDNDARNP